MKERKFHLGDLEVVQTDLGLDFYNRFDGGKHSVWLNAKSVEVLSEILNMKSDNEFESYMLKKDRKQKLEKLKVEKTKEVMKIKYLDCNNCNFEKVGNQLYLTSTFILDNEFYPHIQEVIDRIKQLGVVYGEFDSDPEDSSLSKVSHTLDDVVINHKGMELYLLNITCRLLNTRWGKEVKTYYDDSLESHVKLSLRYVTVNDKVKKIFTADILKNN